MNEKNVLLVYPKIDYEENYKYSWTPFSILALAGVLEARGIRPVLFDQNSDPDADWFSRIEPYLPGALCVGFSAMTGGGQIQNALKLAEEIRSHSPQLPLIWGGPHVSVLPEQTASHPLVDIATVGQGDLTMFELASALQTGASLREVDGIYLKDADGAVMSTPVRPFERKSDLPMYPWHLVDPTDYIRDDVTINTRTLGYVSSQGCPYRCRFCYEFGMYNAWWSAFDAERLVEDITQLVTKHGINGVKFYDADFFVNASRIEKFCHLLQDQEVPIKWAGSANPHDILRMQSRRPEILELIKDTKCTRILMGMESGSDRILELIDKRVTSAQLREVAQIITDYGIIGSFTFIIGFPGETLEELKETLALVDYVHGLSERHESRIHIFAPYPGTPLYATALENEFEAPTEFEGWSNYNYYEPQTPWVNSNIVDMVREYTRMN